jgi:hypothetical protein
MMPPNIGLEEGIANPSPEISSDSQDFEDNRRGVANECWVTRKPNVWWSNARCEVQRR